MKNKKVLAVLVAMVVTLFGALMWGYTHPQLSADEQAAVNHVNDILLAAVNKSEAERVQMLAKARAEAQAKLFAKDLWQWYWNERAQMQIDPNDTLGLYGDDAISQGFKYLGDNYFAPCWNMAMQYDVVRAAFLLFLAGMFFGLGASVFVGKKPGEPDLDSKGGIARTAA